MLCLTVLSYTIDDMFMWLYWCITGFCVLLVGSIIAGAIYMTQTQPGKDHTSEGRKHSKACLHISHPVSSYFLPWILV